MGASFYIRYIWIWFLAWLLSPILPSLALRPLLQGKRFVMRALIEMLVGDAVMTALMVLLSILHLEGHLEAILFLAVGYLAMAIVAYGRKPWMFFSQFTKYSRRILLGLTGWKVVIRDFRRWIHDKLFLPDSFGDRVLRRHRLQWIIALVFAGASAWLFLSRQRGIDGLSDPSEKVILEHVLNLYGSHPFRGGAVSLVPAAMSGCLAEVSFMEVHLCVKAWYYFIILQGVSAVTCLLMLLLQRLRYIPFLAAAVCGMAVFARVPQIYVRIPGNDTAETMSQVHRTGGNGSWTMIAVDDSIGIARAYGIYYPAEDLFLDMEESRNSSDLTEERPGDIYLDTDRIYVCVDHHMAVWDTSSLQKMQDLSDELSRWVTEIMRTYPQNVTVLREGEECTLYLIRQNTDAPLNLSLPDIADGSDSGREEPDA